jgi:hypothetical protein
MGNNKRPMTAEELIQNVIAGTYLLGLGYFILQVLFCLCCGGIDIR